MVFRIIAATRMVGVLTTAVLFWYPVFPTRPR